MCPECLKMTRGSTHKDNPIQTNSLTHCYDPYHSMSEEDLEKRMKKKKSETELTASVLKKKRSKTHKRLKERFLIRRNRTTRANFRRSRLFQATYNNNFVAKRKEENSFVTAYFFVLFKKAYRALLLSTPLQP